MPRTKKPVEVPKPANRNMKMIAIYLPDWAVIELQDRAKSNGQSIASMGRMILVNDLRPAAASN